MKGSKWLSKKSEKYLAEAKELLKKGDLVHKNFYENELTGEVVEKMVEDVEQLIAKLKGGDDNGTSIEV